MLRWSLVVATLAALLVPAAAAGQTTDKRNRALIVLDASKSMNEDAGNGGSRLDAAKTAVHELLDRLPAGSPLGLRVYGSKVSEVSRAEGCRDTELAIPVGPLDKAAMGAAVDGLQGKGRTPIGRSLLATPGDLGSQEGRRTVVLISDGGDNCAPPNPCKAARQVAKQGVDLSISVVGLQVNERVRKQLKCIAKAGGGTYVDVQDAGKLGEELAAALARAIRSYQPSGTKVTGGPTAQQATGLGTGLFQDTLSPDQPRFYAVDVPRGKRLLFSSTAIPAFDLQGNGEFHTVLTDPSGQDIQFESGTVQGRDRAEGRTQTQSVRTESFVGGGLPAGRYTVRVEVVNRGGTLDPVPIPVELGVQLLSPGEDPGMVRTPGKVATPAPKATATPGEAKASDDEGDISWPLVGGVGVGGLLMGLAAAAVLSRRRLG